jgi:hypothetical protein
MAQASAPPAASRSTAPASAGGTDRYRNALEVFRAGDTDGAAAIWESLLGEQHRGEFTVLLLTACQRETLVKTQAEFSAQRIYLVGKKVNGRGCFRVCLGTYESRDAAGRALAEAPRQYREEGAAIRGVADVLNRDR